MKKMIDKVLTLLLCTGALACAAEAAETYRVYFSDYKTIYKVDTLAYGSSPTAPLENPDRWNLGFGFIGWDKEYAKITEPLKEGLDYVDVYAVFNVPDTAFDFTVTGYKTAKTAEDIKVNTPNECFIVKDKYLREYVGGDSLQGEMQPGVSYTLLLEVDVSLEDTCADNVLANIWRYLNFYQHAIDANKDGPKVRFNGSVERFYWYHVSYDMWAVTFVDYDGTILKQERVEAGETPTAPEIPVHEGFTFKGWDQNLDAIVGTTTVKAIFEEPLRRVVFESVSGEVIFEDEMRRGSSVFTPSTLGIIGVPISTNEYVEYVYKWHRIGESGDEYVNPNSLIEVGDSVHYRAEVLDTLYRVSFWDTFIDGGCVKEEMVSIGDTVELPEPPYHKGLIFDGWEAYLLSSSGLQLGEATDFPKVTGVMSVGARYKTEPGLKLDFNLSGYEFGKTVDDIEVEIPNEYFKVTKTMKNMYGNEVSSFEADSVYGMYILEMKVSVEDVDDSLVNAWKYLHRYSSSDQVVSLSTSIFKVEFYDFNGTLLKQELVVKGNPAIAPEEPSHKGIVFKGWMGELDSITMPVSMWAEYEVVNVPEYAFTATGFEAGEATKDIKIETPNDCFTSSIKSITLNGKDEFDGVIRESGNYTLYLNVAVADTGACAEDSLVNVAKVLGAGKTLSGAFTVNGESAHYDGSAKKGVLVYGRSIVVAKSSSSEAESSSSEAKSSSSEAKSSSSKKGDSSSSSKKDNKSSSSHKAEKDAIFALDQPSHFSVAAMGRNIQIAGARVGSVYAVFDMQGHILRMDRVGSENFSLSVPRAGMYLVRVGSQTRKVALR